MPFVVSAVVAKCGDDFRRSKKPYAVVVLEFIHQSSEIKNYNLLGGVSFIIKLELEWFLYFKFLFLFHHFQFCL